MMPNNLRGRGLGRGAPPISHTPQHADHETPRAAPTSPALPPDFLDYIEAMGQNIAALRDQVGELGRDVSSLAHKGNDSQRVFDALHQELNDYKRDFIYEHMKPLLRPLLFLYDSLDGFDEEMGLYETAQRGQILPADAVPAVKVRQNLAFLRGQLIEALGVCGVEMLPFPQGHFDPKTQKAIDTQPVEAGRDGLILQVIRIGWTMHGHLLRPAEVIIGKAS